MSNNVSDIKPWLRDDFLRTLSSIYFSNTMNGQEVDAQRRKGFLTGLVSFALAVGVNPESFLSPEDIQLLRKEQS